MGDALDTTIDDLIGQQVQFTRGRGPEPDLSVLPPGRRERVTEQLKIVAALAGRDPELPPIEDDPVAERLGLNRAARPACCRCDPDTCAADEEGDHCATQACGWCLHGCPSVDEAKCCQVAVREVAGA